MSDLSPQTLPEAARQLGVPLRALRNAMRAGKLPAPPTMTADTKLPPDWFRDVKMAIDAAPNSKALTVKQAEPPFVRYRGTSCFRKYPTRVREFQAYRASLEG